MSLLRISMKLHQKCFNTWSKNGLSEINYWILGKNGTYLSWVKKKSFLHLLNLLTQICKILLKDVKTQRNLRNDFSLPFKRWGILYVNNQFKKFIGFEKKAPRTTKYGTKNILPLYSSFKGDRQAKLLLETVLTYLQLS